MPERDFFEEQKEWSRRKIVILRKYFRAFGRILGSHAGQCVCYVDGFAGPGIYKDGFIGSPVVAAKVAADLAQSPRAFNIKCINVEIKQDLYDNLCTHLADFPPEVVINLKGRFDELLPEILSRVGRSPTLFFLDPFGLGGLDWDKLLPLFSRPGKTEILINFNTRQARRLAGFLDSSYAHAASRVKKLSSVMGTEKWMVAWKEAQDKSQEDRDETLVGAYREQVLAFGRFAYACSYPIRSFPDEALKYHLVYGTGNFKGIDIMNEILCGAEEDFQAQLEEAKRGQPIQLDLFKPLPMTAEQAEQAKLKELTSDILQVGLQHGQLTFKRLKMKLFGKWFGRVKEKHYRNACKDLKAKGYLESDPPTRIDNKTVLIFEHAE